ncbi:MAG: LytTR family DNA-binding domain-containing protein [Hyphomonadaceae bacterium]
MTSGGLSGTSGGPRQIGPWTVVALVGVVAGLVVATSDIMEQARAGSDTPWVAPVLWETTSAVSILALAPFIGMAVRRLPPREDNLLRSGLLHFGLTVPFSLAHILAIWLSREAAYWAVGARYGFFDDGVALILLYEWRKDVLTYAAIAAVYWWFQRRAERPPPEQPGDHRIEIRDGGTAIFLAPSEILLVEAAGNYVEFHTGTRTHLVRGTLAAWEARLTSHGFVRVHRSRLVNRAMITALKPTPSGDVEISLSGGASVLGSRRYRAGLATAFSP